MISSTKIEYVDIEDVKPNPNNPRKISEAKIKDLMRSIKELPELLDQRPLVVDRFTGFLLGGNQRWIACKRLGYEKVPVIYSDKLNDDQKKQFVIKDNMESGEWDEEKLRSDFKDFPLMSWDILEEDQNVESRDIDKADLEKDKDIFENGDTRQIMIYLDTEVFKEATKKIEEIKEKNFIDTNGGVLLYLLANQKK